MEGREEGKLIFMFPEQKILQESLSVIIPVSSFWQKFGTSGCAETAQMFTSIKIY